MPGDARKRCLVLKYPGGDGLAPSWPDLIESIKTAWEVGRIIAEAGSIYAAYRFIHDLVQARLRKGEEVVARNDTDGLWNPGRDDAAKILTVILDEAEAYAHEDRGPRREVRVSPSY